MHEGIEPRSNNGEAYCTPDCPKFSEGYCRVTGQWITFCRPWYENQIELQHTYIDRIRRVQNGD